MAVQSTIRFTLNELPEEPYPEKVWGTKVEAVWSMLLADRGFDAGWIRALVSQHGAGANIPPRRNRTKPICFSRHLYRARNLVERFFNKIKQCRVTHKQTAKC